MQITKNKNSLDITQLIGVGFVVLWAIDFILKSYWYGFSSLTFMFYCSIILLFIGFGLILKNVPLTVASVALIVVFQSMWFVDMIAVLSGGVSIGGGAGYLQSMTRPEYLLTLRHLFMLPFAIYAFSKLNGNSKPKSAILWTAVILLFGVIVPFFFGPAELNINYSNISAYPFFLEKNTFGYFMYFFYVVCIICFFSLITYFMTKIQLKNNIWKKRLKFLVIFIFILAILLSIFGFKQLYFSEKKITSGNGFITEQQIKNISEIQEFGAVISQKEQTATREEQKYIDEFRESIKGVENYRDIPRDIVAGFYQKIGPVRMLDVVEEDPFCHEKGHNIGRETYKNTSNDLTKTMAICGRRCSDACFHGALMEMIDPNLGDDGNHTTLQEVASKIPDICDRKEFKENDLVGTCAHRLGHILFILDNYKFDRPITACEKFPDKRMVDWCVTGIFMEENNIKGEEDAKKPLWYPCDSYPSHANACLRYKVERLFLGKNDEASVACLSQRDTNFRRSCFAGLGFMNLETIAYTPSKLPVVCKYGDKIDKRVCIEAPIGLIALVVPERALEACNFLGDEDLKKYCIDATRKSDIGLTMTLDMYLDKK